jgi:hypothetical protein
LREDIAMVLGEMIRAEANGQPPLDTVTMKATGFCGGLRLNLTIHPIANWLKAEAQFLA